MERLQRGTIVTDFNLCSSPTKLLRNRVLAIGLLHAHQRYSMALNYGDSCAASAGSENAVEANG